MIALALLLVLLAGATWWVYRTAIAVVGPDTPHQLFCGRQAMSSTCTC